MRDNPVHFAGADLVNSADGLDDLSEFNLGIVLFGTGTGIGAVGVFHLGAAWIYDIADTPRAVRSGGESPPSPKLLNDMDYFAPDTQDGAGFDDYDDYNDYRYDLRPRGR